MPFISNTRVTGAGFVQLNANAAITPLGGYAVRKVNKTGAASVRGTVVKAGTSVDNSVELEDANGTEPTGIIYSEGVDDNGWVWVVKHGSAQVKLENNVGTTHGNWARTSTSAAGRADCTNASPPGVVLTHFAEIGHVEETVAGDPAGALAICTVHFL